MATTISGFFSSSNVKTRWKEPYISDGLNRKNAGCVASGIYRGFELTTSAASMCVTLKASERADHVAVIETSDQASLTVNKTGGDITVALDAFASQTVVLAVSASYAIGVETSAELTVYTESEYLGLTDAQKRILAVAGRVVVPASGLIGADSISLAYRSDAWKRREPGAVPQVQLIQNGNFRQASDELSYETPDESTRRYYTGAWAWALQAYNPGAQIVGWDISMVEGVPHLSARGETADTGTSTLYASQMLHAPVTMGERLYFSITVTQTASVDFVSSGAISLDFRFFSYSTSDSDPIRVTQYVACPGVGVTRTYELDVIVPSGAALLQALLISLPEVTTVATGEWLQLTDISILRAATQSMPVAAPASTFIPYSDGLRGVTPNGGYPTGNPAKPWHGVEMKFGYGNELAFVGRNWLIPGLRMPYMRLGDEYKWDPNKTGIERIVTPVYTEDLESGGTERWTCVWKVTQNASTDTVSIWTNGSSWLYASCLLSYSTTTGLWASTSGATARALRVGPGGVAPLRLEYGGWVPDTVDSPHVVRDYVYLQLGAVGAGFGIIANSWYVDQATVETDDTIKVTFNHTYSFMMPVVYVSDPTGDVTARTTVYAPGGGEQAYLTIKLLRTGPTTVDPETLSGRLTILVYGGS